MKAEINVYDILLHGIFAAMGGLVREIKSPDEGKNFTQFVGGAMVGIFAGMVVYFLCKEFKTGEYLTVALTGLAGYSGAPTLDVLTKIFTKLAKLKIELPKDEQ